MANTLGTRLGIFFALALVVAVVILEMIGGTEFFHGGYLVSANFKNAQELQKGDLVKMGDLLNGLFKTFIFALIIGTVSCHQGLATIGGPRGIGRSVTKAVVNSIVMILTLDYFLTRFLLYVQK